MACNGLEVIDKGSSTDAHPRPLLFVHGGWHAAWCWDEHFLDYFAARGYHAAALSLRGHGSSASTGWLQRYSVLDYVEDVQTVADSMREAPVVIGHSMGGFVVQKYLESRDAPAAVLLASVPVTGTRRAGMRALKRHPWLATKSLLTLNSLSMLKTREQVRETLFAPHTPGDVIDTYLPRLQQESTRVISVDMAYRHLPRPHLVRAPVLVLAGECDATITAAEAQTTAEAYGTTAEIVSGIGHEMMLEPGWETLAERMHYWLTDQGL